MPSLISTTINAVVLPFDIIIIIIIIIIIVIVVVVVVVDVVVVLLVLVVLDLFRLKKGKSRNFIEVVAMNKSDFPFSNGITVERESVCACVCVCARVCVCVCENGSEGDRVRKEAKLMKRNKKINLASVVLL